MSFPIVYYNVQWSIGITPGVSFHICDCWSFFFFPSWSWVTNCLRVIHHEEEREKLGTGWANLVLCSTWTDRAILSRLQGFSTWTRPKLLLSSSFALRIPLYYSSTSWYPFFLRLYTPHPYRKGSPKKGQVLMIGVSLGWGGAMGGGRSETGSRKETLWSFAEGCGERAQSLISGSSCFLIESEIKLPLVIITFSSKDHPIWVTQEIHISPNNMACNPVPMPVFINNHPSLLTQMEPVSLLSLQDECPKSSSLCFKT